MATFPESPIPIYPLIVTPRFKTGFSGMESGKEERTAVWLFPKYDVQVRYTGLSNSDAMTLWQFFIDRRGAHEAFYIYDLSLLASVTKPHEGQYVGTGDGSTTTFDIPGRSTSSHDIYINGIEESESNYSILTGGGASAADRVEFDTAPDEGAVITVDFYGYLRIRSRFQQDRLDQEMFMTNLFQYGGIKLEGLAAA